MRPVVISIALIFLALAAQDASAAGCPKKPVTEHGGTHWCYSAGGLKGSVHVWEPPGYDVDRAVTVIYVHGYNIGLDGCTDKKYLDCAWDDHGLAAQFSKSGLNAMFVAIEGPVNNSEKVKWPSLGDMLDSLRGKGFKPPMPVVALGHSAGIFTVVKFLDDARLKHVMMLDAMYQDAPKKVETWFTATSGRRLTLVGAQYGYAAVTALGKKIKCAIAAGLATPYPRTDRCAAAADSGVGHMNVAMGGRILPNALSRIILPSAPTAVKKQMKRPKPRAK